MDFVLKATDNVYIFFIRTNYLVNIDIGKLFIKRRWRSMHDYTVT